jgi:hypothetical protein
MKAGAFTLAALILCSMSGCVRFEHPGIRAASEGVTRFHEELNASHYDDLCHSMRPGALSGTTGLECRQFLAYVHQHLGDVADARRTEVRFYPRKEGDAVVPMNYATRFAGGDATEYFEWIVKGTDAKLSSYRIDADRLKSH